MTAPDAEGASGLREAVEALANDLAAEVAELSTDLPPMGPGRIAHMYRAAGLEDAEGRLRALLAAHPPEPEASAPSSMVPVDAILSEPPMSSDGTGHIADCGYDEEHAPTCGCATLRARITQVIADTYLPAVVREAEARGGARALREARRLIEGIAAMERKSVGWVSPARSIDLDVISDQIDRLDPDAARGERGARR